MQELKFLEIVFKNVVAKLVVIHQNIEIGREDADEDERAFDGFDEASDLDGNLVEANVLGNSSGEERCHQGSKNGGLGDTKNAGHAATRRTKIKQKRKNQNQGDKNASLDNLKWKLRDGFVNPFGKVRAKHLVDGKTRNHGKMGRAGVVTDEEKQDEEAD